MNVTLTNIDLTDTAHLSHAVAALNAYAALSPDLLLGVESIRLDFRTVDLIPMNVPMSSSPTPAVTESLGIYGKTTRAFLDTMLSRISKYGSTTLEDAATEAGISLDTARAYLRNAGRTASAYKVALPVKPEWQPDMGCNTYRASAG
jgi:hypothetical protein